MNNKIYGHAIVGRAGLGNMLLPWARCEAFCREHGVAMLAPQWTALRLGPLLRGERDKRLYAGLFDNSSYVRGLRKMLILKRSRTLAEDDVTPALKTSVGASGQPTVVTFANWEKWFGPFVPHRKYIAERLWEILTPRIKRRIEEETPKHKFIALHVRRGDTRPIAFGQAFPFGDWNFTMPLEWFIETVRSIREILGFSAPAVVFSDAFDEQIKDLLALENVTRSNPSNPSIVDIFLLSKGSALVTSGNSSFSAWASFLGAAPTIFYPGLRDKFITDPAIASCETDVRGAVPESFALDLHKAIPNPSR